jgi:hypothetical protein
MTDYDEEKFDSPGQASVAQAIEAQGLEVNRANYILASWSADVPQPWTALVRQDQRLPRVPLRTKRKGRSSAHKGVEMSAFDEAVVKG